jgi:hypothetical protein
MRDERRHLGDAPAEHHLERVLRERGLEVGHGDDVGI